MKKRKFESMLDRLKSLEMEAFSEADGIASLSNAYSAKIVGGNKDTNNTCTNSTCGANGGSNSTCTNTLCDSTHGMTNSGCSNGTCGGHYD
jgi:hypothetical protein